MEKMRKIKLVRYLAMKFVLLLDTNHFSNCTTHSLYAAQSNGESKDKASTSLSTKWLMIFVCSVTYVFHAEV